MLLTGTDDDGRRWTDSDSDVHVIVLANAFSHSICFRL